MIHSVRIEHIIKGLSDSSKETVFNLICDDSEPDFENRKRKNIHEAKEKYKILASEYKNEIFYLVEFIHEKKILKSTGGDYETF